MSIDEREALERLIRQHRSDYSALSRLIGKNAAYIQQFIKRGVPKRLDSRSLQLLAEFYGVTEAEIGGLPGESSGVRDGLIRVARLDVGASAGPGASNEAESVLSPVAFEKSWLIRLTSAGASNLSMIRVRGDSMMPTLADGDEILVEENPGAAPVRDGIYVLRRDESLLVKRIAMDPASHLMTIKSDNPAYPEWRDCDPATVSLIGRVIWAGRRIG